MGPRLPRRSSSVAARGAALAGAITMSACGGGTPRPAGVATTTTSDFDLIAEGPCARLSAQAADGATFVVYGATGYDLHDWAVGERLAAAQSFVRLERGAAFLVPDLQRGLSLDGRGYVAADLVMGEGASGSWLFAIDTRYAARGEGRLFERRGRVFTLDGGAWRSQGGTGGHVPLPGAARSLPPLPVDTACGRPGLRLVPLASSLYGQGGVLVAGRCQDDSHVNHRETSLVVLRGAPGANAWSIERAPETDVLDGIVNLALHAESAHEAYLVAWEPFRAPDERRPYLARWDGQSWQIEETNLPEAAMSVTRTREHLYVAAGRGLFRRSARGGVFERVGLPPLRVARPAEPPTMRVHTTRVVRGELWVESTYRVEVPASSGEASSEQRASALFRLRAANAPAIPAMFCDARKDAAEALVVPERYEESP